MRNVLLPRRIAVLLLCAGFFLPATCRGLELGGTVLGFEASKSLDKPMSLNDGTYLTEVGGVAFKGVAVAPPGAQLIDISYYPARDDDDRFWATVASTHGNKSP